MGTTLWGPGLCIPECIGSFQTAAILFYYSYSLPVFLCGPGGGLCLSTDQTQTCFAAAGAFRANSGPRHDWLLPQWTSNEKRIALPNGPC